MITEKDMIRFWLIMGDSIWKQLWKLFFWTKLYNDKSLRLGLNRYESCLCVCVCVCVCVSAHVHNSAWMHAYAHSTEDRGEVIHMSNIVSSVKQNH
jgi:hypothetical protein